MNLMKTEGFKFPTLRESDAMFSADSAPEWTDGDVCHRCRVAFSFVQRKHHCRACGNVFCHQCSQKTTTLPKFGIEKEVDVQMFYECSTYNTWLFYRLECAILVMNKVQSQLQLLQLLLLLQTKKKIPIFQPNIFPVR